MKYECSNCGAENETNTAPCVGCKLVSPPRHQIGGSFTMEPGEPITLPNGTKMWRFNVKRSKEELS
jgi:hypothetical protein